jgi:hypothetical protein
MTPLTLRAVFVIERASAVLFGYSSDASSAPVPPKAALFNVRMTALMGWRCYLNAASTNENLSHPL